METVVTKKEFAKLKNRPQSVISQWLAAGRISRAALRGEGVRARICVEQAEADLARNLDPVQQARQDHPSLPLPGIAPPGTSEPAAANVDADVLRRRRLAEAERAEHDAEAARRRNAIEQGRWIAKEDAQREWARELAKFIGDTETFICTALARALAAKYGLNWKELSVEIRQQYRKHRSVVASSAGDEARELEQSLKAAAE